MIIQSDRLPTIKALIEMLKRQDRGRLLRRRQPRRLLGHRRAGGQVLLQLRFAGPRQRRLHQGEGAVRRVQRQGAPRQALLGAQREAVAVVHERREGGISRGKAPRLPGGEGEHWHDGDRSGGSRVDDQVQGGGRQLPRHAPPR
eukprot:7390794-Prymnesium_polylepis.1